MKKHLLLFTFTLIINISQAQNFWKFYNYGDFFDCLVTSDTNIIAVGSTVLKTDINGNTIWAGSGPNCTPESVEETPQGDFIFAGTRQFNMSGSGHEPRIAKIDRVGHPIWTFAIPNLAWTQCRWT